MSHMVIYRGADGKPGYHQTDDIHDAVGFVEQMRNDEGVEHARIFRLEEVVFEYRPYYRVELSTAGTPMMLGTPTTAQLPEPEAPGAVAIPAAAPPPVETTPVNGVPSAPPVNGTHQPADPIDLVDDVIDVGDGHDETPPKVDAGTGKKGLFGR